MRFGEIVEWLVADGELVGEDQPIVAVMTDKATLEIPAPRSGHVLLNCAAGDDVPVGEALCYIVSSEIYQGSPS